ncbi:MAG: hypothetical protein LBL50_02350 [Candidatus Margulisbacteria bacterium]|jgi:hypothetical protein|nr:hypothetical protein [Candidatus Margulisiibacteriota bacterium]
MKKIILAIFTIMLTLAIFGCGKAQQASGGGGSSGGGGGNPTTFTISGTAQVPSSIDDTLYASWPERLGRGLASVFIPQVYAANFNFKPLKNADVKIFEFGGNTIITTAKTSNEGHYTINLPLGKIYVVVVEKAASDGSATINIKNIAHEENPVVDVTPVTSVAVEAISQNNTIREAIAALNSGSGDNKPDVSTVAGIIETVKENVENYYDTYTSEINDVVDVTSPVPPTVPPDLIEEYTLTVAVSPANSGTVTPNGGTYLKNAKVKLQAFANTDWRFDSWSGDLTGNNNPSDEIAITTDITVTANFTRETWSVEEITDVSNWGWDDNWQIGELDDSNKLDTTEISGARIHGLKVGKKDDKLYFMAKLSNDETPNEDLRYQFCVASDHDNNGDYLDNETWAYVDVRHGYWGESEVWHDSEWNAKSAWETPSGNRPTTVNTAELVSTSNIIVASIKIDTIEEILGKKSYYAISINTAPYNGQGNYYTADIREVKFSE